MSEKTCDIFVSFSNADRNISDEIVKTFESYDVDVWYQNKDSKQDYLEQINLGIKSARAFVILLSPSSVNSIMVKNEINRALIQRKREPDYKIVPIIIKDLSEDDEDVIALLLGSFNWLFLKEFKGIEELVLKVFDQIDLKYADSGTSKSIYSSESEIEIERLDNQNALYNSYAFKHLDAVFEEISSPAILDIGCNDGKNIIKRVKDRNYSSLLGVDIDQNKIKQAITNYQSDKNDFIVADILSEEFDKKIENYLCEKNINGFDLIHVASVLLHLKDPKSAIRKMFKYLNKGGIVFIQDEDDGLNAVYPHDAFFDDAFYIWDHSYESGDRHFARKIPGLLVDAGFKDIDIKSTTISSIDSHGQFKETIWDMYFNSDLWVAAEQIHFNNTKAFEKCKEYRQKQPQYRHDYLNGKYFVVLGIFFVTAKK